MEHQASVFFDNPVPRSFSDIILRIKFRALNITSKAPHHLASVVLLSFVSCHFPPIEGQDLVLLSFSVMLEEEGHSLG